MDSEYWAGAWLALWSIVWGGGPMFLPSLVLLALQPVTQPPAERLLDDRSYTRALFELEKSPRVRLETIATSHEGRPVVMIVVGEPEALANAEVSRRATESGSAEPGARLPVMVAGDSWGHEAAQVEGILEAARALAFGDAEDVRQALSKTIALFIPLMNPDGRAAALREWAKTPLSSGDTGAGNAYGFLLNRDFMHGTQPEARGVTEAILRWRPVVVVDEHEDMFNLGVRLKEVAFVEPFAAGLDVEEAPLTRAAILDLGRAVNARWRKEGFDVLFDEAGENRFAPLPEPGKGVNPLAGSAGRLNLVSTLHGIPSFITESARTPGAQSFEDRVAQKKWAALAVVAEVASRPERYRKAVYDRRMAHARDGRGRFVVLPLADAPADGLASLLDVLSLHRVVVFRVRSPEDAFLVPLEQPEGRIARHLLLGEVSTLNELPPALGLRALGSDTLRESDRWAFLEAEREPPALVPAHEPAPGPGGFLARPTTRATALVNRLLASGSAAVSRENDRYRIWGGNQTTLWEARKLSVPLEPAMNATASPSTLRLPRVGLYAGQGAPAPEWGEIAWALEQGGFPYRLLSGAELGPESLSRFDAFVVPNGSATEIVNGFDIDAPNRKAPWQVSEPPEGIGARGLEAIRRFTENGGTYVGLGGGGALLAGKDYLRIANVEPVSAEVGIGEVELELADRGSPLLFGYRPEGTLPAFFNAPPGSPAGGYAFRASEGVVALYASVSANPDELSFTSIAPLSRSAESAAIVHQRFGRGHVVLFGIAPAFRGQWRGTFPLLYNALAVKDAPSRDEKER